MMPSRAARLVQELVMHLGKLAPGAIRTERFLEANTRTEKQLFLGFLGLLASYSRVGSRDGLAEAIRAKLTTHLIQSRYAKDPSAMVRRFVEAAQNPVLVPPQQAFSGVDQMSFAEMRAEIEANSSATVQMDDAAKRLLQRNKKQVAAAYAANETTRAMEGALLHDYELLMTFDMKKVRKHWPALERAFGNGGKLPMPRELAEADDGKCLADQRVHVATVKAIINAATAHSFLGGRIIMNVLLGDLEANFSKGAVPTKGLMLDADHALALLDTSVFATTDKRLEVTAKQQAALIERAARGRWKVIVANTPSHLARAVGL